MPDSHYNNYYGSILDPLHGDIKLSEIEKWILSQPIFSRLRRVKQNTFLYYVFPSSNHTRFEHSIGVMHLASKVYNSCKENYFTGNKKLTRQLKKEDSLFFNLSLLGETREAIYYQELRIAALLHDIGHGPMSHLFDDYAISKDVFLKIVEEDANLNKYLSGFENLIKEKKGKVEHEIMSCLFIFYLIDTLKKTYVNEPTKFSQPIEKIIDALNAERIVKMVEPKFDGLAPITDDYKNDYTHFFSRIISGFPIDADRMDYLLRDSYFSGVTYGIYDINRVFSSFMPIKDPANLVKLGYKESGSDSMLRFIQSRSHLFNQVYFHKTNRAANLMLTHGTETIKSNSKKLLDHAEDLNEIIDFYSTNGDEYFLMNTVKKFDGITEVEKTLIKNLIERKLFKRIYRRRITFETKGNRKLIDIENLKSRIKEKLIQLNNHYAENFHPPKFAAIDLSVNANFKDADEDKNVLLIKKDFDFYSHIKWADHSLEFKYLDITTTTVRIYINQSFENPMEFEETGKDVLKFIKDELKELEAIS